VVAPHREGKRAEVGLDRESLLGVIVNILSLGLGWLRRHAALQAQLHRRRARARGQRRGDGGHQALLLLLPLRVGRGGTGGAGSATCWRGRRRRRRRRPHRRSHRCSLHLDAGWLRRDGVGLKGIVACVVPRYKLGGGMPRPRGANCPVVPQLAVSALTAHLQRTYSALTAHAPYVRHGCGTLWLRVSTEVLAQVVHEHARRHRAVGVVGVVRAGGLQPHLMPHEQLPG
jgi:hypothetical protein